MQRLASFLCAILLTAAMIFGEITTPDFAFPGKVITQSEKTLATNSSTSVERIHAILAMTTAKNAIDCDNLKAMVQLIDSTANVSQSTTERTLLLVLEASVYQHIRNNTNISYRDDIPLYPYPANISEWSAEQFNQRIDSLALSAWSLAKGKAGDEALSNYSDILNYDISQHISWGNHSSKELTLKFLPKVRDFIGTTALSLVNTDTDELLQELIDLSEPQSLAWFYYKVRTGTDYEQLYKEYSDIENARYALEHWVEVYDSDDNNDTLIAIIRQSLSDFPDYCLNDNLKAILATMTRPSATAIYDNLAYPGNKLNINIKYQNCDKVGFTVYRKTGDSKKYKYTLIDTHEIDTRNTSGEQTVAIPYTFDDEGTYQIRPIVNGETNTNLDKSVYSDIKCQKIKPFAIDMCTPIVFGSVDALTGKPIKGVNVSTKSSKLGTTNSDGLLIVNKVVTGTASLYNYDVSSIKYSLDISNDTSVKGFSTHGNIFTDKPIYRPGDTINWAAIVTEGRSEYGAEELSKDSPITVQLRNANYKVIDQVTLTTDNNGRIEGSFTIPTDGLTGNFRISLLTGKSQFASSSITVSEYRMPTFEVIISELQRDSDVVINGKVQTYSGMPIANATLITEICAAQHLRWCSRMAAVGHLTDTTDDNGNFSITIPHKITDIKNVDCFSADITATLSTGETASCTKYFSTGKPYNIIANINGQKYNADEPLNLDVSAYDINGNAADIDLVYSLIDKNKQVVATANSNKNIDWSNVSGGKYTLKVEPRDTTLCDSISAPPTIQLYSLRKNSMPDDEPLFIIKDNYETNANGKATIDFGMSADDTYVYSLLCYDDKVSNITARNYSHGFNSLTFSIPKDYESATVIIMTVKGGKVYKYPIKLTLPSTDKLTIKAESFRDKLTIGSTETWNFTLLDSKDKVQQGAMIATMYNHALDALSSLRWNTSFPKYSFSSQAKVKYSSSWKGSAHFAIPVQSFNSQTIVPPSFAYSYLWTSYGNLYIRGTRNLSAKMVAMADTGANIEQENEVESADMDSVADNGEEPTDADSFDYRDSNVTTAFWQPSLTTDANGDVQLTFTVPNANTTWSLQAFAWTEDLKYASLMSQIVANKPIMVQPNLPRYLRQGDQARVLATVFNNSDNATAITSTIEIFDINSGEILQTETTTATVEAMQSANVGIIIDAPIDASAIGYRVRSYNDNFSDGEQAYIPILESSSTVVESEQFYLNPKDSAYTLTVQSSDNSTNTLQYCENPIWSVVKAMKGIRDNNSTVINAAIALSGNTTAKYIADNNPQIDKVLKLWKSEPQDSALVSMLMRNSDLKIVDLEATPWVQVAEHANNRMSALNEIFDKSTLDKAINASLKVLKDNQMSDGGWRWCSWCNQSSTWITEEVLLRLKLAKSIGILGDNTDDMISRAISFYDKQTTKPSRTHALIHSLSEDKNITLTAKQLVSAEVQTIIKGWRKDNTATKAIDAIILYRNNYPAVAKQIISSIREFGVAKDGQGLTFPSGKLISDYAWIVSAFNMIEPTAPEIDKMRQWLIVQSQATDDLGTCNPDYLIAAIIMSGTPWLDVDTGNAVTINGTAPNISSIEAASGYFSAKVNGGDVISVSPNGITPSYGSVTMISRKQMTEIPAYEGKDIKIEKRIIADSTYTDQLRLGQRVKVLLTITTGRNMEYVTIIDERPATFEPVEQLSRYCHTNGLGYYRENRDSSTRLFISYLPKGTYQITYDMTVNLAGTFSSGIATLQSQYAPELTAHSSGLTITAE